MLERDLTAWAEIPWSRVETGNDGARGLHSLARLRLKGEKDTACLRHSTNHTWALPVPLDARFQTAIDGQRCQNPTTHWREAASKKPWLTEVHWPPAVNAPQRIEDWATYKRVKNATIAIPSRIRHHEIVQQIHIRDWGAKNDNNLEVRSRQNHHASEGLVWTWLQHWFSPGRQPQRRPPRQRHTDRAAGKAAQRVGSRGPRSLEVICLVWARPWLVENAQAADHWKRVNAFSERARACCHQKSKRKMPRRDRKGPKKSWRPKIL